MSTRKQSIYCFLIFSFCLTLMRGYAHANLCVESIPLSESDYTENELVVRGKVHASYPGIVGVFKTIIKSVDLDDYAYLVVTKSWKGADAGDIIEMKITTTNSEFVRGPARLPSSDKEVYFYENKQDGEYHFPRGCTPELYAPDHYHMMFDSANENVTDQYLDDLKVGNAISPIIRAAQTNSKIDMKTFKVLYLETDSIHRRGKIYLAKDKNYLYAIPHVTWRRDPKEVFITLEGIDPESFDNQQLFIWDKDGDAVRIRDGSGVIQVQKTKVFPPLKKINNDFTTDSKYVYQAGAVFEGADPSTFELVSESIQRDKKHLYYWGRVVEFADPQTYVDLGGGRGKDKDNFFVGGRIVTDKQVIQDRFGSYLKKLNNGR